MDQNQELNIERVFDAPLNKVWQAWTDQEIIKQWWGPRGVSIPECEIDLRVGGKIYIVMEAGVEMGPYKGTKWPMLGEFTVVEPQSKLAYSAKAWTEGAEEESTIDQTTELELSEEGGKTNLKLRAQILKFGPAAKMAVEGMQYGFNQQLDKLNDYLAANK